MSTSVTEGENARPGLRQRGQLLAHRVLPGVVARKVAQNTGWLIGERVLRMVGALAVTIWVIRYLGPVDFGILAYAMSLSLIAEVVAGLGVTSIVVRELVQHPEEERELLGSAFVVRFLSGLVMGVSALLFTWLADGDPRTVAVVAIAVSVVPLHALGTFDQAFQARMQSRLSVTARTAGFVASTLAKVVLLLSGASVVAFAVAIALERVVASAGFVVLYARSGRSPFSLKAQWWRARAILRESWPLAIASVAAMISLRIDQVMLKQMSTEHELGIYAAAARLSEVWYFVPVALGTALFPALVGATTDRATYERRLQVALDIAVWLAIALAIGVTIFADFGIGLVYGSAFEGSASILRLQVWAGPFVFMGVIIGRSLLAQGLQRFDAIRYVVGAPINVALNLVLIPAYGGAGAALATLLSYGIVAYLAPLAYARTRSEGWAMTRALLLPLRVRREYLGRGGRGSRGT